jgi:predicted short-subunit dehydrogenase-like oxidoreductase (DUF2520 family)
MKIVLLGSGNVATHLGKALNDAGNQIIQVWSRTVSNARILADRLNAEYTDEFAKINSEADIYILSVTDDSIAPLAAAFPLKDKILVHTSGTTSLALEGISGVLYPLQTFSKQKEVEFKSIPIAIEGRDEPILLSLRKLAESISSNVVNMNSHQRKALHIAAVFACNFSNHLFAIAETILKDNNLEFDLIKPLIKETTDKIQNHSPASVQTGPAVRGDQNTLNAHLEYLRNNIELSELYHKLSQSIINFHEK